MFSETVNYSVGRDNVLDQHQSKELGRYITASQKKNLVLHSLLHNRCKFCINSFSSKGCRNCCLPVSALSRGESFHLLASLLRDLTPSWPWPNLEHYSV